MKRYSRRALASENLRVPQSRRVIEREVGAVLVRVATETGTGQP